jgi:hypothetical protein
LQTAYKGLGQQVTIEIQHVKTSPLIQNGMKKRYALNAS